MDFTREPIIETIITPREGHKIVVRNSVIAGQEEYFVDAVEIVSFGRAQFFRSLDKPKPFLVPVSEYEVLEVREARIVLKSASLERAIKIGGGREPKAAKEVEKEAPAAEGEEAGVAAAQATETAPEGKTERKRDRRRYRKRRGKDEKEEGIKEEGTQPALDEEKAPPSAEEATPQEAAPLTPSQLSSLLQPPPTLISETINRYKEMFKDAFYLTEEEEYKPHDKVNEILNEEDDNEAPRLQEPTYAAEELTYESLHEEPPFFFQSEEELMLKSRLPTVPKEDKDLADLIAESPYEPSEKPIEENNKPINDE